MSLHPEFITQEESGRLAQEAEQLRFRRCPDWLGTFDFAIFGGPWSGRQLLPPGLAAAAARVRGMLPPGPAYGTVFVHRYLPGFQVSPHRDPRSNRIATGILLFGDFRGAVTTVHLFNPRIPVHFEQKPGALLVLPCFDGVRSGPLHSVDGTGMQGVRYALILNEVVS